MLQILSKFETRKSVIKAAITIINSDKLRRSYDNLYLGFDFGKGI